MVNAEMSQIYSYPQYLEAKRSVDDRALNRPVFDALREQLVSQSADRPIRVLELGGGTASMLRRCIRWSLLTHADYTIVDQSEESLAAIPEILENHYRDSATETTLSQEQDLLRLRDASTDISLTLVEADITQYLQETHDNFDLIIVHAVLDLVDVTEVLPLIWDACSEHARYWFTVNFDGESTFLPPLKGDSEILAEYHRSMDSRPGSRYSGRALFSALHDQSASILASGSSDWVVHSQSDGYPNDEAYFLHHIIHTVDQELSDHPSLDSSLFQQWTSKRHEQIDSGELVYIAHQLDFTGSPPKTSG